LIEDLITSARLRLEQFTGRNFVEKTMLLSTDEVDVNVVLPFGPVYEVDSVKVYDTYGDLDETLTADDDYYLIGEFDKYVKFESLANGAYMKVQYKSGYDSDNTYPLPGAIKTAMMRQVKYDYDNRGSVEAEPITRQVMNMLSPYVWVTL